MVWYNNKDVVPMLEVLEEIYQFYKNRHIDMLSSGRHHRSWTHTEVHVPGTNELFHPARREKLRSLPPSEKQHRRLTHYRLSPLPRERPYLHTTHGIRRPQTMQVCHRLRCQCTLFMVNHAGHADWTFRSPKRLPAGNTQEV